MRLDKLTPLAQPVRSGTKLSVSGNNRNGHTKRGSGSGSGCDRSHADAWCKQNSSIASNPVAEDLVSSRPNPTMGITEWIATGDTPLSNIRVVR
ncbi:hypothetical protein AB0J71_02800 [Nonomuraea sp. NPDC049637]|uniref:hypothetical protein n=1 Tax=Nonomuraea sp. NPDC049637 TaxID=3154356 RepID=UPI003440F2B7